MTLIKFIRHGETAWNRDGRWQGHTDIPLNESGLDQARRLAQSLAASPLRFDCIYSSDLARAWQTAEIVSSVIGLPPVADRDLREMDVGRWGGLSDAEVQLQFPDEWRATADGEDIPRGGAERFSDLMNRTVRALTRIAERHENQCIAVVTHGGVIRAALLHVLSLSFGQRRQISRIENTSITTLRRQGGVFVLESVNDCSHLGDIAPAVDMMAERQ